MASTVAVPTNRYIQLLTIPPGTNGTEDPSSITPNRDPTSTPVNPFSPPV